MGNGAQWIWSITAELHPSATQIVEFFHASERLWEVARALFPCDRANRGHWAEARCAEPKAGRLEGLLATLGVHAGRCEAATKRIGYMQTNRERMRYHEFRAQFLRSSSGWWKAPARQSSEAG